jgi:hypothetical protein
MPTPTVNIPSKLYVDLLADSTMLSALRAAGVDNWEGYAYAIELLMGGEDI